MTLPKNPYSWLSGCSAKQRYGLGPAMARKTTPGAVKIWTCTLSDSLWCVLVLAYFTPTKLELILLQLFCLTYQEITWNFWTFTLKCLNMDNRWYQHHANICQLFSTYSTYLARSGMYQRSYYWYYIHLYSYNLLNTSTHNIIESWQPRSQVPRVATTVDPNDACHVAFHHGVSGVRGGDGTGRNTEILHLDFGC